jgi:hypothetical protein
MSDDLVKRLRQYPDVKLPNEAASRIEKLAAALREITWIATPDHEEARNKATDDPAKHWRGKMTLTDMLRANGSWEADAAAARIEKIEAENAELQSKVNTVRLAAKYAAKIRDGRIEKLEAALRAVLRKCSWYDAAIYDDFNEVIQKALEGKDD